MFDCIQNLLRGLIVSDLQRYGFRSLFVLAKIGYDLRDQFADTFEEPVDQAFGPLLEALEDARNVLSLAPDEYQSVSSDGSFRYGSDRR